VNLYLVVRPDAATAIQPGVISQVFPRCYELVPDRVWAIGTPLLTCSDVCGALGLVPGEGPTCVVTRISDYYGFADRALWESLRAWSENG